MMMRVDDWADSFEGSGSTWSGGDEYKERT